MSSFGSSHHFRLHEQRTQATRPMGNGRPIRMHTQHFTYYFYDKANVNARAFVAIWVSNLYTLSHCIVVWLWRWSRCWCSDADAHCVCVFVYFGISCDGFGAAGAHIKIPSTDLSENKLHCRSFHWNSVPLSLFLSAFRSTPWHCISAAFGLIASRLRDLIAPCGLAVDFIETIEACCLQIDKTSNEKWNAK